MAASYSSFVDSSVASFACVVAVDEEQIVLVGGGDAFVQGSSSSYFLGKMGAVLVQPCAEVEWHAASFAVAAVGSLIDSHSILGEVGDYPFATKKRKDFPRVADHYYPSSFQAVWSDTAAAAALAGRKVQVAGVMGRKNRPLVDVPTLPPS